MKKKAVEKVKERKCWGAIDNGVPVLMTMYSLEDYSEKEAKLKVQIVAKQLQTLRPHSKITVGKCSFKLGW